MLNPASTLTCTDINRHAIVCKHTHTQASVNLKQPRYSERTKLIDMKKKCVKLRIKLVAKISEAKE